jgi:hypothetical protein
VLQQCRGQFLDAFSSHLLLTPAIFVHVTSRAVALDGVRFCTDGLSFFIIIIFLRHGYVRSSNVATAWQAHMDSSFLDFRATALPSTIIVFAPCGSP